LASCFSTGKASSSSVDGGTSARSITNTTGRCRRAASIRAKASWKGRYRGQRQKWFALRFEGDEAEIDIEVPGGEAHPEFDAWRWERMERLPELIVPFKRHVYENVVKLFGHLAG
jgi:8-oxo-dGTP pyrophosphatase MutT (NUDIX family)